MTHKELRTMLKELNEYQLNQISKAAMRYLALNQELAEITPDSCPCCGDQNAVLIRKGVQCGRQRFQCKFCGRKFTYDTKQLTSNSHQPMESWVVVLEDTLSLASLDSTAEKIGVCHSTAFHKGTLLINKQHNRAKGEKEFHFSPLKNSRPRVLTPASAVMDALKEQQRRQAQWAAELGSAWENSENLVFTTQTGRYVNNKTLWMNFKRIVKELGMPELRFHDLRHTFSINSLQAGDDIKTVQENLGHATASFTLATYAHATLGMKRESANRMDAFIRSLREDGENHAPVS